MKFYFFATLGLMVFLMLFGVGTTVRRDNSCRGATAGQCRVVGGRVLTINAEGCAEAADVCRFGAVAGGHGGGECNSFFQLAGEDVWIWCQKKYPQAF